MPAPEPVPTPLGRLLDPPPVPPDVEARDPLGSFAFWGGERTAFGRHPGVSWSERLRGDPRAGVAVLLAVALLAGVLWYRIGIGGTDQPSGAAASRVTADPRVRAEASKAPPSTAARTAAGTKASDAELVVHVAGAVMRPGIVRLRAGSRVFDAIDAAGGARPEADLDQLNLAAKVVDGQRIGVGLPGQPATATGATGSPGGSTVATDGFGGSTSTPLNLNTATQAEIELLPGIGPVLGAAILRERDERGGFRSVDELRSVRGIGEKRFEDLRDLVTV